MRKEDIKKGDKIRIKSRDEIENSGELTGFIGAMSFMCGNEYTVKNIYDNCVSVLESNYLITYDMIEDEGDKKMGIKIGDKVRVMTWEEMAEKYGVDSDGDITAYNDDGDEIYFFDDERDKCGKVFTITDKENDVLGINKFDYIYDKFVVPYVEEQKKFKIGNVVRVANGDRYIVFADRCFNLNMNTFLDTEYLNSQPDFMIEEFFDTKDCHSLNDILNGVGLKSIWKKKEVKKLTKEDIEKLLGYEVEIVE